MTTRPVRPALWWRYEADKIRCLLCPHACLLETGDVGLCGVRHHKSPTGLISLTDRTLLSLAVDPVEKKPLYHWRPGTRILSLGTRGCNLSCPFCQNHELALWRGSPPGEGITPEQVAEETEKEKLRAVAFTYNEPIVWYEFVLDAARELRSRGIAVVLVTNGQISSAPAALLAPLIDAANVDLKAFSEDGYQRLGGHLKPTLDFIGTLLGQHCHVEVTHLLVPGLSEEGEFRQLVHWIASLDRAVPLHITRYFPRHLWHAPPTDIERMKRFAAIAKEELQRVYLGNLQKQEKTRCLHCGHDIVVREEYNVVAMELGASGKCLRCGTQSDVIVV